MTAGRTKKMSGSTGAGVGEVRPAGPRAGTRIPGIRAYLPALLGAVAISVLCIVRPEAGTKTVRNTVLAFGEMLSVLPPIFLLLGLLDTWVPRETVMRFLGERSGVTGVALSVFLGAAAAGPLYGAFPVAAVMMRKGARFFNILVFLGAWSTLKIPMFLFEMSALGPKFAVTRWLVNVVGIIAIAGLMVRLIPDREKQDIYARHGAPRGG